MGEKPSIPNLSSGNSTILVAEDDDISFALIEILLSKQGNKILRATTGLEVIKLFKENQGIALILMDLKMPVMDGYDAAREIRKMDKEIPIIAQTAYALTGDRKKALEAGCNDYVTKPIKKDDLIAKIEQYLQHS